jgi:hypothetical protein
LPFIAPFHSQLNKTGKARSRRVNAVPVGGCRLNCNKSTI